MQEKITPKQNSNELSTNKNFSLLTNKTKRTLSPMAGGEGEKLTVIEYGQK